MRPAWFHLLALVVLMFGACDKATPVAPSGSTITLTVTPNRIGSDSQARISAFLRKADGSAVNPGTEVTFGTTLGILTATVVATDDRGNAETLLNGAGQVGTATVSANSGGATEAVVDVQIGSFAFSVTLVATPASIPRGGASIELLSTVRDDLGQLVQGIAVTFDPEIGVLDSRGAPVITNANGEARDRLSVASSDITVLPGDSFLVSALAATEGGTLIEATATIFIEGGAGRSLTLQATPSTVPDTGDTITLVAVVRNSSGDPESGIGVTFETEVGSLTSRGGIVPTNPDGEAEDTLEVTQQDLSAIGTQFTVGAQTTRSGGQPERDTATIRVQSQIPTASFEPTLLSGFRVQFDAQASTGGQPLTFTWDFGDSTAQGSGALVEHDYSTTTQGNQVDVTLTVTNAFGSAITTQSVTPTP